MFDSTGKKAIGRGDAGSRPRSKAGRRLQVESLEVRQMLTASLAPIANITSPQYLGNVVALNGGSANPQTFTVSSDVPGVKASVIQGKFLTIGVSHTASGAGDIDVNGSMKFQLFDELTPLTTTKIESLINGNATGTTSAVINGQNFYVGKTFFRIANGFPTSSTFIVQGGSASGTTASTPSAFTQPFDDEFIQSLVFTGSGQLAMANSGPDTNDSQFFITTGSPRSLDHKHTIWGQLVEGAEVLEQLTRVAKGGADGTTPINPVTITTATLSETDEDGAILIDTTNAPVGATANIRVTASDATDNTTATQTFQVNVTRLGAGVAGFTGERPYLGPVEPTITVGQGQTATFQLTAVNPDPTAPLTYVVKGGASTSTAFTDVQNVSSATVDANGRVTIVPTAGFSGTISLLVGVRAGTPTATETPGNFDTQRLNLVVNSSPDVVPLRPIANSTLITAQANTPAAIQLIGTSPTAGTGPLTYAIRSQPTNGTISNFNPQTGTLTYTPNPGYAGPDSFTFESQTASNNLASLPATIRLNVANASTGAVRYIADDGSGDVDQTGYLVVTPRPRRKGTNDIRVIANGENIQVTVNGVIDAIQPEAGNVNRIIIYGSKANDRITVDGDIVNLVTIDGGHGGKNVLRAGSGDTTLHGWFGQNNMKGGAGNDTLIGRRGRVKFLRSGGDDIFFAGTPRILAQNTIDRTLPTPETGTFYKFVGNKLVETKNPYPKARIIRMTTKS